MNLELPVLFLILSLLVGIGITIQMLALFRHNGKVANLGFIQLLSAIDMLWFVVCGIALYFLDLTALQKSVPLAFIVYGILSFFYAGASIEGMPTRPEDVVFGKSYLNFGLSFAFVFVAWTLLMIVHSLRPLAFLSFL